MSSVLRLSARRRATCGLTLALVASWATGHAASAAPRAERLLVRPDGAPLTPPATLPLPLAGRRVLEAVLAREGEPEAAGTTLTPLRTKAVGGDLTEVVLRQEVDGVPVFRGTHSVFVDAEGRARAVRLGDVAEPGRPGPFLLTAERAAVLADAFLSEAGEARAAAKVSEEALGEWTRVRVPGLPEPASAARCILAEGPVAAWRVELARRGDPEDRWCVLIDATTGDVRRAIQRTRHAGAQGRVFPRGAFGPHVLREWVDGEAVMDPSSPSGWTYADVTEGNNCTVWEDRAGDGTNTPGLLGVGTGDPLTFDFPFTGAPADDLDVALTNVFWAVNLAHDRFHALGFDEAAGNAQVSNFGRGGDDGDYTRVFVQYAAGAGVTGIRNSNTAYANVDGGYNSLTFGLWDRAGEIRDGGLDTGLVFHEYAHIVVSRLVGGDPTCDDGTQPRALAEGWADYFAAAWTGDPVIGAWVSGDLDVGLRTQPIDRNRYGYANLCNILGDYCNSNQNGEIWAGVLWDLRRRLTDVYGAAGQWRADRLIVEGMRYTPCVPTFVDARDGLLAADRALHGGADHCLIWSVMLSRGLGPSAASDGPDDPRPTPGFDLPPECTGGAGLAWERGRYGTDADARLVLSDATAGPDARSVRVTTPGGDQEDLELVGPGFVRSVVVPVREGAVVPGDGVLQVVDGDSLEASCAECPGAPLATAAVTTEVAVVVSSYEFSDESCHDDDSEPNVADFRNEIPSILDAGERATLTVTLGNAERFPLEDVTVTVSCDHPAVHVLPRTTMPLGDVRAKNATAWPIPVRLRVVAEPAPAVQPGDTATLTLDVTARGFAKTVQLTMPLAADYADLRGVEAFGGPETFEPGSATAAQWTHAPAGGQPADQWAIQPCGDGGGRAMVYAGDGCVEYDDTPSAATLVSPPLFDLGPDIEAVRPTGLSWRNWVDLGRDPRSLYCDSEMVLLYLTDDPARPEYDDPRSDRFAAAQYWAQWTALGDERNTDGWVTQGPRNAINDNSVNGMSLPDVRLYWVFYTDVYNPENNGGCRTTDPDAVGLGYRLDDVGFTYDAVQVVPPADASCTLDRATAAFLTITPREGPRCPGDPLVLSGELSDAANCPNGTVEYRFTGPGVDTGYTPEAVAMVQAAPGARWTLRVRCTEDTSCNDSVSIDDPTLDDVTGGRLQAGSLRAVRSGDDVLLSWWGTHSPVSYTVFRAEASLLDSAGRWQGLWDLSRDVPDDALRRGEADDLSFRDVGAAAEGGGLACYRVLESLPCTGAVVVP